MFRDNIKSHLAIFVVLAFAIGMNRYCIAQATQAPSVDTPTQRWLPAPRSFPTQQENQAKLLSLLRDSLLQGNTPKDSNSSRLSDADVKSLKEAMKQFESYFPEGLTADSLDSIPPELISKALSNPELMKQAKDIASNYSKRDQPKKENEDQGSKFKETNRDPSSEKKLPSEIDPKENNFADLMNKLRSTQQSYEQNKNQTNKSSQPTMGTSSKERSGKVETPPTDLDISFPFSSDSQLPSRSQSESRSPQTSEPSRQSRQPSANSNSQQPTTPAGPPNSKSGQSSKVRGNSEPNTTPNLPNPRPSESSLPSTPRSAPNSVQQPEYSFPPSSSDTSAPQNGSSKSFLENEIRKQADAARDAANSSNVKLKQQSSSSLDIRKELDSRGFGPTMQKIVEEAQRAGKAARPKTTPVPQPESNTGGPTGKLKVGSDENKEKAVATAPANLPSTGSSKTSAPSPRNQRADSPVSKSMQKTGEYLNKLWTDATKNSTTSSKPSAPRSSTSRNSTSSSFSRPEVPSIPNPFSAQFLQYLLILAVACIVAFFVLKMKFKQERERKIALAAQLAPEIDEIQTRDDVVRAFHAMARQRLQSAQAWWTCGHVAERFQETLPEHTQPIRTLSGLYEQARYYPAEHQLTADQIQTAKLALKQCEG